MNGRGRLAAIDDEFFPAVLQRAKQVGLRSGLEAKNGRALSGLRVYDSMNRNGFRRSWEADGVLVRQQLMPFPERYCRFPCLRTGDDVFFDRAATVRERTRRKPIRLY